MKERPVYVVFGATGGRGYRLGEIDSEYGTLHGRLLLVFGTDVA